MNAIGIENSDGRSYSVMRQSSKVLFHVSTSERVRPKYFGSARTMRRVRRMWPQSMRTFPCATMNAPSSIASFKAGSVTISPVTG